MSLLIRNGTLVTAIDHWVGDLLCRDGKIAALGEGLEAAGAEEVDASGQYVFPGGVDPHVHLSLPVAGTVSADDFESGTAAALAGGTTTVIDFVHPERGEDPMRALAARREEAAGAAVTDYGLHMAVTWWGDDTAVSIRRCVEREGIPSFKTYMAYKETVGLDDDDLIRVMAAVRDAGGQVIVHAEHGELIDFLRDGFAADGHRAPRYHALSRPSMAEGEAVARAATLAEGTGASLYVFHVTCREALHALARARERGQPVFGETCPHYLLLDDSVYDRPDGAAYVCAPPIRPTGHQEALWAALRSGLLQVVSTDHCPFTTEQKRAGERDFRLIPGGVPGIEHRLTLLYTYGVGEGRLDLHQFVQLVATRPAKLFGLYPRKGSLTVGADADLVLWDPEATATLTAAGHQHRCDHSVYEGLPVQGLPSTVIANGEIRYRDGELKVDPGAGRYLYRALD